jgi:single-strand DNA-binding protein
MFDTTVTIVGNVITTPEWRRTTNTQTLVAHFKVASNSRKFDKDSGRWIDGDSLRVRVNCWRKLAEGVASSVMVGDPVVVTGRMYSRDWSTEDGQRRVSYELEAFAVGHDLSRGRATFQRNRGAATATSTVEDDEAENRVGGEPTTALSGRGPVEPELTDDLPEDSEPYGSQFDDFEGYDAAAPGAEGADDTGADEGAGGEEAAEAAEESSMPEPAPAVGEPSPPGPERRGGRRGRTREAVPA